MVMAGKATPAQVDAAMDEVSTNRPLVLVYEKMRFMLKCQYDGRDTWLSGVVVTYKEAKQSLLAARKLGGARSWAVEQTVWCSSSANGPYGVGGGCPSGIGWAPAVYGCRLNWSRVDGGQRSTNG